MRLTEVYNILREYEVENQGVESETEGESNESG